jgi:hypothetical protein
MRMGLRTKFKAKDIFSLAESAEVAETEKNLDFNHENIFISPSVSSVSLAKRAREKSRCSSALCFQSEALYFQDSGFQRVTSNQ